MPFGIFASVIFKRLMNTILADLTWKIYILYLNNVIIYGKIFEKEIINLKNILPTWSMSS